MKIEEELNDIIEGCLKETVSFIEGDLLNESLKEWFSVIVTEDIGREIFI